MSEWVKSLIRVRLFAIPWTVAYQAPPSMGFSRQEYWSGLLCLLPGDLPQPRIEPTSLTFPVLAGGFLSEVAQSCPTLCDPVDCSLSGSSVHGIFQARVLEWTAISFSRGSSWPRNRTQVSRIAGRRFAVWATREAQNRGLFLTVSLKPQSAKPNHQEEWR